MFQRDFPFFHHNPDTIFFDSASSAQKPQVVIDAVEQFLAGGYANIHRGAYDTSLEASHRYETSKKRLAALFGMQSHSEVVYTYNATYAFNMIVQSLVKTGLLSRGDTVLLSQCEHHANIVPWHIAAEEHGIRIEWVRVASDGTLDYDDLAKKLPNARVLSLTLASNVTGEILDIERVQSYREQLSEKPLWIADGSQFAPHHTVSLPKSGIDIFVGTGHKMMSDTGIGFLIASKDLLQKLLPSWGGGGAINWISETGYEPAGLPFRYEPGTPHIVGAISLLAALDYIESIGGYAKIAEYEQDLIEYFLGKIPTLPEWVRLLGSDTAKNRVGVFSFAFSQHHPHDIAEALADAGIAVRSGHHCAEPLHHALGIGASLRASLYMYNTKEEIDTFFRVFSSILST